MNKIAIYTTVGTLLLISGTLVATGVYAEDLTTSTDTFVTRLAEKLGVDESEVETAVEEVRTEYHEERQVEREEKINQALEDGTLTQRQAEILLAMDDVRPSQRGEMGAMHNMSEEEREAEREERRTEMQSSMLESLNAEGLEVTQDELDTIHDISQDLELGGGMGKGGMFR